MLRRSGLGCTASLLLDNCCFIALKDECLLSSSFRLYITVILCAAHIHLPPAGRVPLHAGSAAQAGGAGREEQQLHVRSWVLRSCCHCQRPPLHSILLLLLLKPPTLVWSATAG